MQSAAQGDQIHFEICDEIKDFNTQNDKKNKMSATVTRNLGKIVGSNKNTHL